MKTAYSNPAEHFYVESFKSLFPGLEFDYGGLPNHIMDLTHASLVKFHRDTHNPSNSLTIIYGRGDMKKELSLLNSNFKKFERKKPLRPDFSGSLLKSPVKKISPYPAAKGEEHSYIVFSYVLGDAGDPLVSAEANSLAFLLAGYEDAPLKKEIVRSGLATDVGISTDSGKNKSVFFIVFEGVKKKNEGKIEPILKKILKNVAESGFGDVAEEAAKSIQKYGIGSEDRFELSRGEKIFSLNSAYMLGKDYRLLLDRQRIYDEYEKVVAGKDSWKLLVKKMLLDNEQRAVIIFRPDEHMFDQQDREIKSKLGALRKKMNSSELKKLQAETEEFQRGMEKEIHTDFPRISLGDWKHEKLGVRTKREDFGGVKILHSNLKSNGLVQIIFAFDISRIPLDILPAVAVYDLLFDKLASKRRSYADLYLEQSRILGHPISRSTTVRSNYRGSGITSRFLVTLRGFEGAMNEKAFDLLNENLFELDYEGQESEIKDIIDRRVQEIEMSIRRDGYYVFSNASTKNILNSYLGKEKYYLYLKDLLKDWNRGYKKLLDDLEYVKSNLLVRKNLVVGIVGRKGTVEESRKYLEGLPLESRGTASYDLTTEKLNQARIIPARNYRNYLRCDSDGRTWEIYFLPKFLAWNYLYPEIRTKNGAYGSKLSLESDQMTFYSYSDPNIVNTFDVFRNTPKFLKNLNISNRDFEGAKINALALYVYPETSFGKGIQVLGNYLAGRSDADIKREYNKIKNLKQEDVRSLGNYIERCLKNSHIATLGPKSGIDENKDLFDEVK
jgi:Zn-dependent M16 (insulinase) family peptidase